MKALHSITMFLTLALAPLVAQESKAAPPQEAKAEAQPEAAKTEEKREAATTEGIKGTIDFGYRWNSDVRGSFNSYRSVVNLGEGPKLFGIDLTMPGSGKLYDRIDLRMNSWGGDPYNTARMDVKKQGAYNLTVDYRNINYFNFLPSFADPGLESGLLLNQRSLDLKRRWSDVTLDLLPGKRFTPYFGWTHDGGNGRGISNYVAEGNEYPLQSVLSDKTDLFRGGVRMELNRVHITLEQGGAVLSDDQQASINQKELGNRLTPILGQQLFLNSALQSYGVSGHTVYTKGLVSANVANWLDVYGNFVFSQPRIETRFTESAAGNFVSLSNLLFYTNGQALVNSQAKQPHTSASAGVELRPVRRLRIVDSFLSDRMHNGSGAVLAEQILQGRTLAQADRLEWTYNQQQIDAFYDVTSKLTLRGGHRYVWGDARVRAGNLGQAGRLEAGELRRQVGLAGITFRPAQKVTTNFDYEGSPGNRTYFRSSLDQYHRLRARVRWQFLKDLSLAGQYHFLDNQNPNPAAKYDYRSQEASASLLYTPNGGKRISFLGEYSRSSLHSDITFLDPTDLQRARSYYRDYGHSLTSLVDVSLPKVKLSVGGSAFLSSGSRPTDYYQPLMRLAVPIQKHVNWKSEWRYFGLSETFYRYEGFRAHLFITGLQIVR